MYDSSLNRYVQGPIGLVSVILLIPSFTGIVLFIKDRHIKYAKLIINTVRAPL